MLGILCVVVFMYVNVTIFIIIQFVNILCELKLWLALKEIWTPSCTWICPWTHQDWTGCKNFHMDSSDLSTIIPSTWHTNCLRLMRRHTDDVCLGRRNGRKCIHPRNVSIWWLYYLFSTTFESIFVWDLLDLSLVSSVSSVPDDNSLRSLIL